MLAVICLTLTLARAAPGAPPPAVPPAGAPVVGAAGGFLDRQALIAAVLDANPGLEAARAAVAAAEAARSRAGLLEDPMLSYGVAPASLAGGVLVGQELRLSQRWSPPARRRLLEAGSASEAERIRADLAGLELELAAMAGSLFADYYLVTRELEITARHRELVEDLKRAATGRYAAGLAEQNEPLRAEVELGHLHHRAIELEAERAIVVARINALLHRAVGASLPGPPPELAPAVLAEIDLDTLAAAALEARPELDAAAAEIEGLKAASGLARLAGRPDLDLMASYNSMWSDREHRFMVGVAVSPPLSKVRRASARTEAEARLTEAESEKLRLTDQVLQEVATAVARLRQSRHHLELYDSRLLPASRDEVRAATAGFEASKVDLLAVIEAERMLREVELGRHLVLAEMERSLADLDRAVGHRPDAGTAGTRSDAPLPREGGLP